MRSRLLLVLAAGLLMGAGEPRREMSRAKLFLPAPSKWVGEGGETSGGAIVSGHAHTKASSREGCDGEIYLCFFVQDGDFVRGRLWLDFPYRANPNCEPAQIDLGSGDRIIRGIYRFEGSRLVLCFATTSDAPRPSRFETKQGDGHVLLILKREKP